MRRCETEPRLLASWTPAQGRVLMDISTCLKRMERAREKYRKRESFRKIRRGYYSDTSLFAASSEEDSSQLQSDIREAIEDYNRAIQFYKDYYPSAPESMSSSTHVIRV